MMLSWDGVIGRWICVAVDRNQLRANATQHVPKVHADDLGSPVDMKDGHKIEDSTSRPCNPLGSLVGTQGHSAGRRAAIVLPTNGPQVDRFLEHQVSSCLIPETTFCMSSCDSISYPMLLDWSLVYYDLSAGARG